MLDVGVACVLRTRASGACREPRRSCAGDAALLPGRAGPTCQWCVVC